jgi:hypothetical protein
MTSHEDLHPFGPVRLHGVRADRPQASGGRRATKPARASGGRRVVGGGATRERRQDFLTAFWCRAGEDDGANYFALPVAGKEGLGSRLIAAAEHPATVSIPLPAVDW